MEEETQSEGVESAMSLAQRSVTPVFYYRTSPWEGTERTGKQSTSRIAEKDANRLRPFAPVSKSFYRIQLVYSSARESLTAASDLGLNAVHERWRGCMQDRSHLSAF